MTVLVVGAGISGLAAAYELGLAGIPTIVVDPADRLGGKVGTERFDGHLVERGPDSFLTTRPAAVALCRELGLGDELIGVNEPRTVSILRDGRRIAMPDGLGLFLPTKVWPFVTTPLFGWTEKARMALDVVLPRLAKPTDEAVGAFLRRRLGHAMVDRLAGPLVGGIYGTAIDDLSLDAVVPALREAERSHRSLLLAGLADGRRMRAARVSGARGAATGQTAMRALGIFASLRDGTGRLIDALGEAIKSTGAVGFQLSTAVRSVERSGAGLSAQLSEGSRIHADAVLVTAPGEAAARLLEPISAAAAQALRAIPHGSSTVVTFGWRRDAIPPIPSGHGVLVPRSERLPISALTFSSQKWDGRAPADGVLLRAFLPDEPAGGRSVAELVGLARVGIRRVVGIDTEPEFVRIATFVANMPRYTVGHIERVHRVEAALAGQLVEVAGAAYHGVGLPDCIADARSKARVIAEILSGSTGDAGALRSAEPVAADA